MYKISIDAYLDKIRKSPDYQNQIVHIEEIPAKKPIYKEIDPPIPNDLLKILQEKKINKLFSHQVDAIQSIRSGNNVVIATSTSSGKTLCYTIPILESFLKNPNFYTLFIFPLKALAQDQLGKLREFNRLSFLKFRAEIYDGDIEEEKKDMIRRNLPQVIITNPDEIHYAILPNHARLWSTFFRRLKFIVADEIHTYRGVFGSNVANIFRRFLRIAKFYGSEPQIICCSATIANPKELASQLFNQKFNLIDNDGSFNGPKKFVFWNPPIISNNQITGDTTNIRKSVYGEGEQLFISHIINGLQNLAFTRSRKMVELLLRWARRDLEANPSLQSRIMSYRAGYFPEERRQIEKKLLNGELLGVLTTNALELGIDVGQLDASILIGYPGTISSTWQQAGRAGRRDREALITLIGSADPLDQYFMNNPHEFFKKPFENAVINPFNPYILTNHILCAAYENSISDEDKALFGSDLKKYLEKLEEDMYLEPRNNKWVITFEVDYPAKDVIIRSASQNQVKIFETTSGKILGNIEYESALKEVHPNALYFHLGESYFVEELDLDKNIAHVKKVDFNPPYYTEPLINVNIRIIQEELTKNLESGTTFCFGKVRVTELVHNWVEIDEIKRAILRYGDGLNLPPISLETKGFWIKPSQKAIQAVHPKDHDLAGGLHAIEHASIAMLPLIAMCDRRDLGGVSAINHSDTNSPVIFVYDSIPGGIGLAEKAYQNINDLMDITLKAIADCPCSAGCPSCIQSPKCGNRNQPLDKDAAIIILRQIIGLEPNLQKTPKS